VDKLYLLNTMMQNVKDCDLCCKVGQKIPSEKLLKNFIAERPNKPLYGQVPSIWTDWAHRLDARIAVVGQDWGPWLGDKGILEKRQRYEQQVERIGGDNGFQIWRTLIDKYNQEDDTSSDLIGYFKASAELEGSPLPRDFIDNVFVTNSVLCARAKGQNASGSGNFDAVKSIRNCCSERKFLHEQLDIVKPTIVIALGEGALRGLELFKGGNLRDIVERVQASATHYISTNYYDLPLKVVPVYHPAARPRNRKCLQQIQDYRFIWKALSNIMRLSVKVAIEACMPTTNLECA
jgi:uracil-DNA glycosylase family 4